MDRFIWWHWIRGHKLEVHHAALGLVPMKLTRCQHEDCNWYWSQYLV